MPSYPNAFVSDRFGLDLNVHCFLARLPVWSELMMLISSRNPLVDLLHPI